MTGSARWIVLVALVAAALVASPRSPLPLRPTAALAAPAQDSPAGGGVAKAAEKGGAWCERAWFGVSARFAPRMPKSTDPELVKAWQAYGASCAGTVAYEGRLAMAYVLTGQSELAKGVLAPLDRRGGPYGHLVDFGWILIDAVAVFQGVPEEAALAGLAERLRVHTARFPESMEGLSMLGALRTMLGQHEAAVAALSRCTSAPLIDLSGVHRNLTISLAALERYELAKASAEAALELRPELTSDPQWVYAVATTWAALGDLTTAGKALQSIGLEQPAVREDPRYRQAVQFVLERKKASAARK